MATIHAGDCQNGCKICANNYHSTQVTCDTCGVEL